MKKVLEIVVTGFIYYYKSFHVNCMPWRLGHTVDSTIHQDHWNWTTLTAKPGALAVQCRGISTRGCHYGNAKMTELPLGNCLNFLAHVFNFFLYIKYRNK